MQDVPVASACLIEAAGCRLLEAQIVLLRLLVRSDAPVISSTTSITSTHRSDAAAAATTSTHRTAQFLYPRLSYESDTGHLASTVSRGLTAASHSVVAALRKVSFDLVGTRAKVL